MTKAAHTVILLIGVVYILYVTKVLLLPFVIALLIWYFVKSIRDFLAQNEWVRRKLPLWLQNVVVFGIIFGVLAIVGRMLAGSIDSFVQALPRYEANIFRVNRSLVEQYNVNALDYVQRYWGDFNFSTVIEPIINSLSQVLSDGFLIVIYVIFIMLEESTFSKKHRIFFKNPNKYVQSRALVHEIDQSFSHYISIKTFTSFLTGMISYIILLLLGVDSPTLWAILIFLLNFIPNIGSILATLFPTLIAILQSGELSLGLWVLGLVGSVQIVIGNFVEPKMMGNSLNISPLVVILSLVAWGAIWGILGMVLSVPLMVMAIIIMSKFDSTRPIAVLLSENGRV